MKKYDIKLIYKDIENIEILKEVYEIATRSGLVRKLIDDRIKRLKK